MSFDPNHLARHLLHGAHQEAECGHNKLAGVVYIVVGFFLTPALIGFPLMVYGFYKLFK
jgi:hypothetical protein